MNTQLVLSETESSTTERTKRKCRPLYAAIHNLLLIFARVQRQRASNSLFCECF